MPTPRGAASLVLGIAAFMIARGFGTPVLVPLAVVLVLAPIAALVGLLLVRADPRLDRRWNPSPTEEGSVVTIDLRLAGIPRVITRALVIDVGHGGPVRVLVRRHGGLLIGSYRLGPLRRGIYSFAEASVVFGDPFGLAERQLPMVDLRSLVVRPRVRDAGMLQRGAGTRRSGAGQLRVARPVGYDLHAIREHQSGESLRRVDWKSTAKRQRLMVRELEDTPTADLVIVLDLDAAAYATAPDALDAAVRAAASLAGAGRSEWHRIAVVAAGAHVRSWWVGGVAGAWDEVLDGLAGVRADRPTPIEHVLADPVAVPRGRTLILITPGTHAGEPRTRQSVREPRHTILVDVDAWDPERVPGGSVPGTLTPERAVEDVLAEVVA